MSEFISMSRIMESACHRISEKIYESYSRADGARVHKQRVQVWEWRLQSTL